MLIRLLEFVLESIVKIKSNIKVINNSFDENFTSDLESILSNLVKNYSDSNPNLRISCKDLASKTNVVFNKGELVDFPKNIFR